MEFTLIKDTRDNYTFENGEESAMNLFDDPSEASAFLFNRIMTLSRNVNKLSSLVTESNSSESKIAVDRTPKKRRKYEPANLDRKPNAIKEKPCQNEISLKDDGRPLTLEVVLNKYTTADALAEWCDVVIREICRKRNLTYTKVRNALYFELDSCVNRGEEAKVELNYFDVYVARNKGRLRCFVEIPELRDKFIELLLRHLYE